MAYVGTPIDTTNTFTSLQGKRFSGDNSETDFTLDVAPSSTLDIEVFVGNVRQDPNSAYTVSGTTLTFSAAPPTGTNNIYVVHQAKAVSTIDVPTGGVVAGSLGSSVLTGQTDIGGAIADADLFLVDDGAGGTLRKTAASRLKTYIGDNTPSFSVTLSSDQSISTGTWTKITFDTEYWDSDSAFASNKFTVPSGEGGKYYFGYTTRIQNIDDGEEASIKLYKNGSQADGERGLGQNFSSAANKGITVSGFYIDEAVATDYYEVYARHEEGGSQDAEASGTVFFGYKLIGV
jgi:hypothetical protein